MGITIAISLASATSRRLQMYAFKFDIYLAVIFLSNIIKFKRFFSDIRISFHKCGDCDLIN